MADTASVREVGLRDGLQLVREVLPSETKLEWCRLQAATGFMARMGPVIHYAMSQPVFARRQRGALIIESSNAYARHLLEGIASYVRTNPAWSVFLAEQRRGDKPPGWLHGWQGDGIIARIENEEIGAAVQACGVPVVDVSAARVCKDVPWVETDDQAIGDLAYQHLLHLSSSFRLLLGSWSSNDCSSWGKSV